MNEPVENGSAALRRWLGPLLVLPLLTVCLGSAHYGFRSSLTPAFIEAGLNSAELSSVLDRGFGMRLAGFLVGGIIAAASPHCALLGATILLTTSVVIFGLGTDDLEVWSMLHSFGWGMGAPALWGLAIMPFKGANHAGRLGLLLLLFASLNLGSLVGTGVRMLEVEPVLHHISMVVSAGLAVLLVLVSAALSVGVEWTTTTTKESAVRIAAAVGVGIAVVPFWATFRAAELSGMMGPQVPMWMYSIDPVLIMSLGGVMALGLGVAHQVGVRALDLILLGLTLITAAATLSIVHPDVLPFVGVPGVMAQMVGGSMCFLVIQALCYTRIAGNVHWRVTPLLLAFWMICSHFVSFISPTLALGVLRMALPVGAVLLGLAGVVLTLVGIVFRHEGRTGHLDDA